MRPVSVNESNRLAVQTIGKGNIAGRVGLYEKTDDIGIRRLRGDRNQTEPGRAATDTAACKNHGGKQRRAQDPAIASNERGGIMRCESQQAATAEPGLDPSRIYGPTEAGGRMLASSR